VTEEVAMPLTAVPDVLSTRDVSDLSGATYRQIDYWCRMGLVCPSVRESTGSGAARLFSRADVLAVRLVKVLVANHLDHDVIRAALDHDLTRASFLWVQEAIVGKGDAWDLLEALAHVRATVVVNLAPLRAGLDLT
jgi:DNA-binding transcriptional MerR regulator